MNINAGYPKAKEKAGSGAAAATTAAVNCPLCEHYYVTWDPSFPRGCRLYGFKTSAQPHAMVHEATGGRCQSYKKKAMPKGARPKA